MVCDYFVLTRRLLVYCLSSFVILFFLCGAACAASVYSWQVAAGDWSIASNWGGAAPTSSDGAFIGNGGTATITTTTPTCGTLTLGNSAGNGTVLMSAGGLAASGYEFVGNTGTGTFYQSGGTNGIPSIFTGLYLGNAAGSSGSYNLSGSGLLAVNFYEYVGFSGSGTITQTGGTASLANDSGNLYLGYNSGSNGVYNLSGSALSSNYFEYVGYSGKGVFAQTGGTNVVGSGRSSCYLYLGYNAGSSGTYNLSGQALLSRFYEDIGFSGTGTFTQSGGSNVVGSNADSIFDVGVNPGSVGSYNLDGQSLFSSRSCGLGGSGTGTFTQSGGTSSIFSLELGDSPASSGTYNLNGGVLIVGVLSKGSGSAAFNFNGGSFRPAGDGFSSALPMKLGTSVGGATFDTAGDSMTILGSLSGPGGLTKTGSGALVLDAVNSYGGNTLIAGGTLALVSPRIAREHTRHERQRIAELRSLDLGHAGRSDRDGLADACQ